MRELIRRHHISFIHAWDGVKWAFSTQPNFRVHLTLSAIALIGGAYFRISYAEYLVIMFTILLGLTGEMVNTALESMTDLITTEWKKDAKSAKDVSAGMMLLVSIGAMCIAGIIFIPRIVAVLGLY